MSSTGSSIPRLRRDDSGDLDGRGDRICHRRRAGLAGPGGAADTAGQPTEIASAAALRAPTVVEPFRMDDLGRSVLSRVIQATESRSPSRSPRSRWPCFSACRSAPGRLRRRGARQVIMPTLDILMGVPGDPAGHRAHHVSAPARSLVSLALAIVYLPIVPGSAGGGAGDQARCTWKARAVGATAAAPGAPSHRPNCVTPLLFRLRSDGDRDPGERRCRFWARGQAPTPSLG